MDTTFTLLGLTGHAYGLCAAIAAAILFGGMRLSKKLPPHQAAVARQMAQQEQSHAACLKGIYTMITGRKPIVPPPVLSDDPPDIILRRCYGREMRCLAQYEARQNDVQYGHVFRSLARQEQEHCHRILEIFGVLAK